VTRLDSAAAVAENIGDMGGIMTTPADLLAMRNLLGMDRQELAKLLEIPADELRTLERMRTHFVYQGHVDFLENFLTKVADTIDGIIDSGARPDFIFTFPVDAVFAEYEPTLAAWMNYASVHRMFAARLQDEFIRLDHRPTLMEIVPQQYAEFLQDNGLQDSDETRVKWAEAHRKVIVTREGWPNRPRKGG
jgi:hypothetical protein